MHYYLITNALLPHSKCTATSQQIHCYLITKKLFFVGMSYSQIHSKPLNNPATPFVKKKKSSRKGSLQTFRNIEGRGSQKRGRGSLANTLGAQLG